MIIINALIQEIEPMQLNETIGRRHDEARLCYRLLSNTARGSFEIEEEWYRYAAHHVTHVGMGRSSRAYLLGEVKEILNSACRRRGGDLSTAYMNAEFGTDGGLRAQLDIIADGFKQRDMEYHVNDVFDRLIGANSFQEQVSAIREFFSHYGSVLGRGIDQSYPERYARDYKPLIRAYVDGMERMSSSFRRL